MAIDWHPLVQLIAQKRSFLLTTHVRPDADGLGSMLGLAAGLRQLGKQVLLTVASSVPARYHFLDPQQSVTHFTVPTKEMLEVDAIFVLDTGTWNQLGEFGPFLAKSQAAKAVIDHHKTQDELGGLRFVDTSAEATGRLSFELCQALGVRIEPTAAQALFAALAMDTGWFRHQNTTPVTFDLAAQLQRLGAEPTLLYDRLFEHNTLGRLKLMGLILDRLQVVENGLVAWTELRRDDYSLTGAQPAESEDLVNFTRSLAGIEVGLFFMEQPKGGVKVSFRSRSKVDVAQIAQQFGGGGHRLASGATLSGTLDEARQQVLAAVRLALS